MAGERRDVWSALLGILTFLLGVGLVVATFWMAKQMFATPPQLAVKIEPGKTLDIAEAVNGLLTVLIRVVLLLVMCGIGSVIANRGIRLYASGLHHRHQPQPKDVPPPADPASR